MTDSLYADHLDTLMARAAVALQRAGRDHLLIASGVQKYQYLDDRPYPFAINPHFKHWLPLTDHPQCWLAITPGSRPLLVYYQPDDYWHQAPEAPSGDWVEHVDIRIVTEVSQIAELLPPAARSAIVGEQDAAIEGYVPDNPAELVNHLHYHRAFKTPYELELMRRAQRRAVHGHRAAEAAFHSGGSELAIHRAYLAATGHNDLDLPYGNIVGLNEHAAVLHYQVQSTSAPAQSRSLLIDAGASHAGYAADITRTYHRGDEAFAALVDGVERVQLTLVDRVRADKNYADLHIECHLLLAETLQRLGIVEMTPEAMLEAEVSRVFFPHGLGHLIGLQVHDVAGIAESDHGGRIERPAGHPALRLTRTLQPGMVVTIEPGLYFIDSLLAGLRSGPHAEAVNWKAIDHLRKFGGVRIEDEVVCTDTAPENLSRNAFAEEA